MLLEIFSEVIPLRFHILDELRASRVSVEVFCGIILNIFVNEGVSLLFCFILRARTGWRWDHGTKGI